MRWLINYIRECFCDHWWVHEEIQVARPHDDYAYMVQDIKVIKTCKKCGYHKSYWKIY